jgi:hypothetical protein
MDHLLFFYTPFVKHFFSFNSNAQRMNREPPSTAWTFVVYFSSQPIKMNHIHSFIEKMAAFMANNTKTQKRHQKIIRINEFTAYDLKNACKVEREVKLKTAF